MVIVSFVVGTGGGADNFKFPENDTRVQNNLVFK